MVKLYRVLSHVFGAIGLLFASIAIFFENRIHEEENKLIREHVQKGMGEWRE